MQARCKRKASGCNGNSAMIDCSNIAKVAVLSAVGETWEWGQGVTRGIGHRDDTGVARAPGSSCVNEAW